MAIGSQQHADLVLGLRQMRLVDCLGDHPDPVPAPVGLEIALDRDHDEVVLGIAEDAPQCLGDAHYFIGNALDGDRLADGVFALEKARSDVIADERHRCVAAHLLIGDPPPHVHLDIVDRRDVVGDALQVDILHRVPFEGHSGTPRSHHPQFLHQDSLALEEFALIRTDLGIALIHLEELLRVPRAEPRHADHAEPVRSHVGDLFGDVHVHSVDQGGDGDQGGGRQNNPQQGQEATELILAERIDGDPGSFPEGSAQAEFSFGHGDLHLGDA